MSRRARNVDISIRGPNSALTAFLREQGINANEIRLRHEARLRGEIEDSDGEENGNENAPEEDQDSEEEQIRVAGRLKRRAAGRNSDNDFEDSDLSDLDNAKRVEFGDKDNCVECDKMFTLTVYSRYVNPKKGYLCEDCHEVLKMKEKNARKNQLMARKKRQKVAAALLDKSEVRVPKLQDICIAVITKHIESVEVLGDISKSHMDKISRILSRNRSLNDKTMQLFLEPSMKEIEFWDCSNLTQVSYDKIGAFCPNLEKLTLSMCGQLHNDNLKYLQDKLTHMKRISLNGPFLINELVWQEFFESMGTNLEGFNIANTHRFSTDSLISMLENCPNISELSFSRLDGVNSGPVLELIPHYLSKLTHFEFSYPTNEDLVTDDFMINLLSVNGQYLETLILDGCSGLTNDFLINGIRPFCPNLRNLSLKFLDQISDEGMIGLFEGWDMNDGLINVSLQKCTLLGSEGILAMLRHSHQTLIELNLNSVYGLTSEFFLNYFKEEEDVANVSLPLLTSLDIGFVKCIDDDVIKKLSIRCPKLTIVEVYGNNKCVSSAGIRPDLKILGRQSDTI